MHSDFSLNNSTVQYQVIASDILSVSHMSSVQCMSIIIIDYNVKTGFGKRGAHKKRFMGLSE